MSAEKESLAVPAARRKAFQDRDEPNSPRSAITGTGVGAEVSLRKRGGLDIKILPHHFSGHPSSCLTLTETGNTGPGGYALTFPSQ